MKKNKAMRMASVLLVAVLLTTCIVSGTYAKYVTQASAGDSARVAKWGVLLTVESDDMFASEYDVDDTNYDDYTEVTVKGTSDAKVVAPGTSGDLFTFGTAGTKPEVSYEFKLSMPENVAATGTNDAVTYQQTIFTTKKYEDATNEDVEDITGDGYYPLVFKIVMSDSDDTTDDIVLGKYNDLDELADAVNGCGYLFDVDSGNYYYYIDGAIAQTTGENAAPIALDEAPTFKISWAWSYGTYEGVLDSTAHESYLGLPEDADDIDDYVDEPIGSLLEVDDQADTFLGDMAAGVTVTGSGTAGTDYNLDVLLTIVATATQID